MALDYLHTLVLSVKKSRETVQVEQLEDRRPIFYLGEGCDYLHLPWSQERQRRQALPTFHFLQAKECGLERVCPYCFQFLVPDGYRVRLKPKMKVSPQIEKVLKREAKNHKLNMKQTKLLKKYRESRSVLGQELDFDDACGSLPTQDIL
ncbi:hypothetical protein WISP_78051 [Willisornis vidua]|uniref:Uncharacterized protein n=1 Tax=Willisornis vidua TaxID=1566151 RepID=A0ABQ9D5J7_9PASS|nr:hypothetical protein WISP_78051 [Willisornis vidua]